MASWFYAAAGKQQGPFGDAQFRDLIAQGVVRDETLVWTEGMAGWQKAAEIPGLMSGGSGPQEIPGAGTASAMTSGSGRLSIDFGILEFTWRILVLAVCLMFVIPAPWAFVWYAKWIVSCVQVPGRPNLGFTGDAMTLVPWYFGFVMLAILLAWSGIQWLDDLLFVVQVVLYWFLIRWMVANIAANGQPLGFSFSGSFWAYLGWNVLFALSFITIIGWAWVWVAEVRWFCRNIQGTRRDIVFKGTGLQFLWRAIVGMIGICFIIPIPWVYRWLKQWHASQTELVPRGAQV